MPDDTPPFRYTAKLADTIEREWQARWEAARTFVVPNPGEPGFDASRPKFYCLDMFPYPSGAGLHVGHPEGYTATDVLCRYKRMCGCNVLHPMGYDAFGLPAEQYAIQTGVHPAITTKQSIATFRRQLQRFGFCYDWSREIATIDPAYYRWTQWVFLRLYNAWYDQSADGGRGKARPIGDLMDALANEYVGVGVDGEIVYLRANPPAEIAGPPVGIRRVNELSRDELRAFLDNQRLAYVGETTVNWCPALGTVLANDEVIDGRSERGGYPVLRKPLKQWMFRITAYAQRLLDDLVPLDWPASTKTQQSEWIGRSEGAEIEFEVVGRLSEPTPSSSTTPSSGPHPFDSPRPVPCTAPGFVARNPYPPGDPTPSDLVKQVRNLPHLMMPGSTYFVTWRGRGWHLNERGRDAVMRALMHFDGERCDVYAACVMDTHVHWIVRPYEGVDLRRLVESVKRFSAKEVNAIETMSGPLWQPDAFDHIVRDTKWLGAFLWYCARNPVEAGLVPSVRDYRWSYVSPLARNGAAVAVGVGAHWAKRGVNGEVVGVGSESRPTLRVFTTRPDTLFGATYMVVAPEHELVDAVLETPGPRTDAAAVRAYVAAARNRSDVERMESKEKTGVDLGIDAINPATGKPIPVWVADYVLMSYGTGAIMAVPSGDERDFEFATRFGLPVVRVVEPPAGVKIAPDACYSGEGLSVNSSGSEVSLDGLATPDAKARIVDWLERKEIGRRRVNYKLRDWTFSRQRYWGEPFPIVYDEAGNHYGVSDAALPVVLPELADYKPVESEDPAPLLEKAKDWVHTTAGEAGVAGLPPRTPVRRETNTMPGSAGSSWYFLRYCDAHSSTRFVGEQAEAYWMKPSREGAIGGVDFYVGGNEHAVGHLLYSRFWHKVLYDLGHVSTPEPFQRLFHQGLITAYSYQRPDKTLVPSDRVEELAPEGSGAFVEKGVGTPLVPVVAKMSKSLKNVVNPDDIIAQYGADTFRLYEMYMGPLEASKPWNTRDMVGLFRFLQRVWRNIVDENTGACTATPAAPDDATLRLLHKTIAGVRRDIEAISFNTAIAKLIELNNHLATVSQAAGGIPRAVAEPFTLLLAPFAPHIAEELWRRLGHARTLTDEPFPSADESLLVESEVEIAVQVLGKVKGRMMVPAGAEPKAIEALVLADPQVQRYLGGKPVKKVIVVPGRLVNFVV